MQKLYSGEYPASCFYLSAVNNLLLAQRMWRLLVWAATDKRLAQGKDTSCFLVEREPPALSISNFQRLHGYRLRSGGYGYIKYYPSERYSRDVRITTIYEGTSKIF